MINESLNSALKNAKSLETLYVSRNMEINLSTIQRALETCKNSLTSATFLNVRGIKGGFRAHEWVVVDSIRTLHLRGDGDPGVDFVSGSSNSHDPCLQSQLTSFSAWSSRCDSSCHFRDLKWFANYTRPR
jgi:hypothetical protein